jgi:hypothetical protein
MKNKHNEYYQEYIENLNLTGGIIENSNEYSSASSFTDKSSSVNGDKPIGLVKISEKDVSASKNGTELPQKEANNK